MARVRPVTHAHAVPGSNHAVQPQLVERLASMAEDGRWATLGKTTLSLKQIAERLHLGKPKGAKTNLHKWMYGSRDNDTEPTLGI